MNFREFRNVYGGLDVGLHQAVAGVLDLYRKEESRYPKDIKEDDEEGQYTWIFKKIDRALDGQAGIKHKLANPPRLNKPDSFINILKDWIKEPLIRRKKAPSLGSETEPLLVFYYFKFLHRGEDGELDGTYGEEIRKALHEPGELPRLRAEKRRRQEQNAGPEISFSPSYPDGESDGAGGVTDGLKPTTVVADRFYDVVTLKEANQLIGQLPPHNVEEICFDQLQFTQARPTDDPLGILKALIHEEDHGLSDPEVVEEFVSRNMHLRDADAELSAEIPELDVLKGDRATELAERALSSLREPSEDFLVRLLSRHANRSDLVSMLDEARSERDELAYAAIRCCMQLIDGANSALGAYLFGQLTRVTEFSDFTRGMAFYFQSIFSNYRGDMSIAQNACGLATNLILSHYGTTGRENLTLVSRVNAHRAAHIFTMLNPNDLDSALIEEAMSSARLSCETLGVDESHFTNIGGLMSDIEREGSEHDRENCYFSCSIYHLIEAVQNHSEGKDVISSFQNNMEFNKALARLNPRTACVMLTPMASLANLTGADNIAKQLYIWRNKSHPVRQVNLERDKINANEKHTSEYAANLLSLYNYLAQRERKGEAIENGLLDRVKSRLTSDQADFDKTQLGAVARYAKRFDASLEEQTKNYVASELIPAGSHHMHIGVWADDLTQSFVA